jgi:hypothetical protein
MVLNHAALDRIKYGAKEYGLAQTCSNFEVTHDVGMGKNRGYCLSIQLFLCMPDLVVVLIVILCTLKNKQCI